MPAALCGRWLPLAVRRAASTRVSPAEAAARPLGAGPGCPRARPRPAGGGRDAPAPCRAPAAAASSCRARESGRRPPRPHYEPLVFPGPLPGRAGPVCRAVRGRGRPRGREQGTRAALTASQAASSSSSKPGGFGGYDLTVFSLAFLLKTTSLLSSTWSLFLKQRGLRCCVRRRVTVLTPVPSPAPLPRSAWGTLGSEMTDQENNNSISSNPFAALFSSLADAKQFAAIQKQQLRQLTGNRLFPDDASTRVIVPWLGRALGRVGADADGGTKSVNSRGCKSRESFLSGSAIARFQCLPNSEC